MFVVKWRTACASIPSATELSEAPMVTGILMIWPLRDNYDFNDLFGAAR